MFKKLLVASALIGLTVGPAAASPAASLSIAKAAASQRSGSDVEGNALSGTLMWIAGGVLAAAAIAYIVIELTDEGDTPLPAPVSA